MAHSWHRRKTAFWRQDLDAFLVAAFGSSSPLQNPILRNQIGLSAMGTGSGSPRVTVRGARRLLNLVQVE